MKFGVREVCNVSFSRLSGIGPDFFEIDTAKMTTLEGAASTVYAQGGWGNSRLMAWEGDKTITFTLEDALISMDAFEALTGTSSKTTNNKTVYTVKTTSFAGTYTVSAKTLFRDSSGNDHLATIYIPKAKLQTNLSLSMSPTGDPSSFTYTFDALANEEKVLYTLTIDNENYSEETTSSTTVVIIDGSQYTSTSETPVLAISEGGVVSFGGTATETTLTATQKLTNFTVTLAAGDSVDLKQGSSSNWYIL